MERPANGFDVDTAVLDQALAVSLPILKMDLAVLSRIGKEKCRVLSYRGTDRALRLRLDSLHPPVGCVGRVIRSGQSLAVDDMRNWEKPPEEKAHPLWRGPELRAYIGVPVRHDGKLFGVLEFFSRRPRSEPFPDHEKRYAEMLAAAVSLAVTRQSLNRRLDHLAAASQQRLSQALTIFEDAYWEWDLRMEKAFFSERYLSMLGYPARSLSPGLKTFMNLTHPEDRSIIDQDRRRLWDGASRTRSRIRLRHADRGWRWIECRTFVSKRGDDGSPLKLMGTHTDVTDAVHYEKHHQEQAKMRAMGELTSGICHDLNNVLAAVASSLEIVKISTGKDPERAAAWSQKALEVTKRGGEFLNRLLEFARPRKASLEEFCDAPVAIRKQQLVLSAVLGDAIQLELDIATEESVHIPVSEDILQSIVLNLCINSRNAMPDGGRVRIGLLPGQPLVNPKTRESSEFCVLSVEDSGSGIASSDLERIVEPFFSANSNADSDGLGLTMVYRLMETAGGFIKVQSQPGEGTTFRLCFPVTQGEKALPRQSAPPPGGHVPFEGLRALVVEDEPIVRTVSAELLEEMGFHSDACGTGSEALDKLDQGLHFDLILTDVVMPGGVSGWQVAERAPDSTRVLFMSGNHTAMDALGEDWFLAKPFTGDELMQAVRRLCQSNPVKRLDRSRN